MANNTIDISESLNKYLTDFDGARGEGKTEREKSLFLPFQKIAAKMLYGGYFVVLDDNGNVIRRVYLHTVEFYYHEEHNGAVKDYIVYHRNPDNPQKKPNPLPSFPIGTLHTHVSGVDITFEDNRHPENPEYRASVLIRAFRVEEVKTIPGLIFTQTVDERSTYFYNALFMGVNVIDGGMRVYWHDNDVKECEAPLSKPRLNVGKFVEKTHKKGYKYYEKKKEFEQDERSWAFYR